MGQDEDLKETVIGTQEIYRGRIVHLRVDSVRLPDGKEAKREVVGHGGAVCIVPITDDGQVVLIRQFRLPASGTLLEIPAGGLELGEEPEAAAARELQEETGYRAAAMQHLFSMFLAPGYSTELIHTYLATGLTPGDTHMDEDERVVLTPMPLHEAVSRIMAGEVQDAKTIAGVLAAARRLQSS